MSEINNYNQQNAAAQSQNLAGNQTKDADRTIRNTFFFVCIFLLFVFGIALGYHLFQKPQITRVECVIHPDSKGSISPEAKALTDSLIQVIKCHEQNLDDRYNYFLQQRENYQDYLSIGGLLITIIVSALGFLGYKSLSSMEDRMKDHLNNVAKLCVNEYALKYVDEKFSSYIASTDDKIEAKFKELSLTMQLELNQKIRQIIAEEQTKLKSEVYSSLINQKDNPFLTKDDLKETQGGMQDLRMQLNKLVESVNTILSSKVQNEGLIPQKNTESIIGEQQPFTRDSTNIGNPFNTNEEK